MTRALLVDRVVRVLGIAAVTAVIGALIAPVLVTVIVSFSGDGFFAFPPESWGLRQYREVFDDPTWLPAVRSSLQVAVPVALISALLSVPTAFALHRSRLPGRHAIYAAGLTGIVVPISAFAIALYGAFSEIGLHGTYVALVLGTLTFAMPIMLMVVAATLNRIPEQLEHAAMTAGASRGRAWLGVTTRALAPAIGGGALLAFAVSLDEAVLVNFLGGADQTTLPKAILESARFAISPVITAIATLMMAATSVLVLIALLLTRRRDD